MKIRKATLKDLEAIRKLNQELFKYEYKNFDKTLNCNWPLNNKKYFINAITKRIQWLLLLWIKIK